MSITDTEKNHKIIKILKHVQVNKNNINTNQHSRRTTDNTIEYWKYYHKCTDIVKENKTIGIDSQQLQPNQTFQKR